MNFIDMHMHTIYGHKSYCSIEELLEMAKANGVKVVSFTDHNTLKSYFELKKKYSSEEIERKYGVRIVVGVEVNSKIGNQCNDILAYNIRDIEEFQKWLESHTDLDKTSHAQHEQLEHYKKAAKRLGLKFDEQDTILTREEPWAGRVISKALAKYSSENSKIIPEDELKDGTLFFMRQCNNPDSEFFFNIAQYRPKVEDLISKAHECGGLVFLAHPGAYNGNSKQELLQYLELGKSLGIDGVEIDNCFNQNNSMYIDVPTKFCRQNNLYMSAGTDIHTRDDSGYTRGDPNVPPRYAGVGIIQLPNGECRQLPADLITWARYWNFNKELPSERILNSSEDIIK